MLALMVSPFRCWRRLFNPTHARSFLDQVYDWFILFDLEVEHVWRSEWGVTKILYIVSRYGPLFDMPITITSQSSFLPHLSEGGNANGDSPIF